MAITWAILYNEAVSQSPYTHNEVEQKWRLAWEQAGVDVTSIHKTEQASEKSQGKSPGRSQLGPFYNLMMFPYPSAEGLHVGNMYAFTGSDIYGRYKRMQGYDVFEPIGLDGFGIHSENYALKIGRHPMDHARITEKNYYNQLKNIGAMIDWAHTVETYDIDYYRWTQWLFVQMFKHGLAYRGKAKVNFCPSCQTVLADEQVIDDVCERCGNKIEKRLLEQWFFRITAYAEKLLENSFSLDWSEKVKVAQQHWIGKKEGINVSYAVVDGKNVKIGEISCFTTRPDTNFGAKFVVITPENPFITQILRVTEKNQRVRITKYITDTKSKGEQERMAEGRKKTGVNTGVFCINPLNSAKMPLYISDFVVVGFGTGAVVGVPGHDVRDFEFATTFELPVTRVVKGPDGDDTEIIKSEQVYEGDGTMMNSGFLDGLDSREATQSIMDHMEKQGWGKRVTTYHLRDWLISRQRYWGPPIPMVHCDVCESAHKGERADMPGWYTVPEDTLPVVLPRIEDYKPGNDGIAPLAKHKEFYETTCPGCGGKATRETDVSDTFLDSSWYFLRYPSVHLVIPASEPESSVQVKWIPGQARDDKTQQLPWDPQITKTWLPVDMYTGGAEHSVLHLMYSRFVTMALKDWGYLDFEEPFTRFYAHGLVIKDGAKMSKSKGNVVNPDEYIRLYGADALRIYLMFMGPFDQGGDFRDSAMEGMSRWVKRIWKIGTDSIPLSAVSKPVVHGALQKLIKKVGEDLEKRRYNTAIASMMEFTNLVADENNQISRDDFATFLLLLASFAPYVTEELWQRIHNTKHAEFIKNHSIHHQPWPIYDLSGIKEESVIVIVQVNGKLRDQLQVTPDESTNQQTVESLARASEKVKNHIVDKKIIKTIFVPGKLVNFVIPM